MWLLFNASTVSLCHKSFECVFIHLVLQIKKKEHRLRQDSWKSFLMPSTNVKLYIILDLSEPREISVKCFKTFYDISKKKVERTFQSDYNDLNSLWCLQERKHFSVISHKEIEDVPRTINQFWENVEDWSECKDQNKSIFNISQIK